MFVHTVILVGNIGHSYESLFRVVPKFSYKKIENVFIFEHTTILKSANTVVMIVFVLERRITSF